MARDDEKPRRVAKEDVRNNARESGGTKRYFNLPAGVDLWEPSKEASYVLDFFPYVIKTETHPDRKGNKMRRGDMWYKFPFKVHRNIGPSNEEVVCPTTFGNPCPICEERARLAKNYNENEEEIKAINAKQHAAYIIRNPDDADRYAVFAYSTFKFGEPLDKELKEGGDDVLGFYDTNEDGRTLTVRFSKESFKEGSFLKATRIDFKKRGVFDDQEVLDAVPCLDEIFTVLEYEDLKKLFLQVGEDDTNPVSPSTTTGATNKAPRQATGSGSAGGSTTAKNKAPGRDKAATSTPAPGQSPNAVFKDGDRVQFPDPNKKGKMLTGIVDDVDFNVITIKTKDGKEYDVNVDDGVDDGVELIPDGKADAPDAEEPKAKAKVGKSVAAPKEPVFPENIQVGSTVTDDEGNTGVVSKIANDEVKFADPVTGVKYKADIDDCTLVKTETKKGSKKTAEPEPADPEGDDDNDSPIKEGTRVSFTVKGKALTGTVEEIEEDGDCTIKDDAGKSHVLDVDDLEPIEDDGGSVEGEDDDGPHEWAVGDKVMWDDGDEEGRIVKLHSGGEKVKVGTANGEVWVPIDDDLKFVPKE